jgi:hypothetical protein
MPKFDLNSEPNLDPYSRYLTMALNWYPKFDPKTHTDMSACFKSVICYIGYFLLLSLIFCGTQYMKLVLQIQF